MGARHKLNAASIAGSALIAGFLGGICESWGVFWIALAILVVCNLHSGDIRPSGRGPGC